MRAIAVATATAALLALSLVPALAGLQRWEVVWLDAAGNPAGYGKGRAEASAGDSRGFVVSIGCAPAGGHVIALTAPAGMKPDFAGASIHPGLRISKPGTDLYRGAVGPLAFDGRRYVGPVPGPVLAPLRQKVHDGVMMLTELGTHTTVKLELQSMERALAELPCG